jgi:hypothetical protein
MVITISTHFQFKFQNSNLLQTSIQNKECVQSFTRDCSGSKLEFATQKSWKNLIHVNVCATIPKLSSDPAQIALNHGRNRPFFLDKSFVLAAGPDLHPQTK